MGTRSGTVDPAIVKILSELNSDLSITKTIDILNKESGVLGVSGISSDFRDIETAAGIDIKDGTKIPGADVDARAKLALDIFNYSVAKFIGSFIVVMGGVDAVVFTAGIGENSPYTRSGICENLNGIGISIDAGKNGVRGINDIIDITANGSKAKVLVIPTNEELVIARDTKVIIENQ
jgi:acetate kinase